MSNVQNSPSFCLFCYKSIDSLNKTANNVDKIEKFVKIVTQFVGREEVYPFFELIDDKDLIEFCDGCYKNIDNFCLSYDQIKELELKLTGSLDKLVETIKDGDLVPERENHVTKVLGETFLDDYGKSVKSQYRISKFRQSILEVGQHKKVRFQPSVLTPTEDVNLPNKSSLREEPEANHSNEEKIIIEENLATPNKSESFTIPNDETDSDDNISRLEHHSGESNDEIVEYPCTCNECIEKRNLVSMDSDIEIVEHHSQPQPDHIQTSQNCGEIVTTALGPQVDTYHHDEPQDWKMVFDKSLKKFGSLENVLARVRSKQKKRQEMATGTQASETSESDDEVSDLTEVSNSSKENVQQRRYSLEENQAPTFSNAENTLPHNSIMASSHSKASTSGLALFECEVCTRKFTSIVIKNIHFKRMHDLSQTNQTKSYKCRWSNCQAYFVKKHQLGKHYSIEHDRTDEESVVTNLEIEEKNNENFVCESCGKDFQHKYTLKMHLECHKDPSEWRFECNKCGKKYLTRSYLREHVKIHDKEIHECQHCGVRFRSVSSLHGHLVMFHLKREAVG